jgi:HSP20 family protein
LDSERIAADYADGVLRLRIPVREQAKPRRVDISVGSNQSKPIEATSSDEARQPAGATTS